MQKSIHVAIIGGGIGGLTVARALSLKGVHVSVFEKASHFIPTAGAGFGFSPNGQICLHYLGLTESLQPYLHPLEYHHVRGGKSGEKILYCGNHLQIFRQRVGFGLTSLLRADLIHILTQSLPPNTIHYNKTLIGLEQSPPIVSSVAANGSSSSGGGGVKLHFAEDSQPIYADIVIGADGIHSTTAKLTGLEGDKPIYSGENIFYGVIDHLPITTATTSSAGEAGAGNGNSSRSCSDSSLSPLFTVKPNELFQLFSRGEYIHFPIGTSSSNPQDPAMKLVWAQTYKASAPPPSTSTKASAHQEEWTLSRATTNGDNKEEKMKKQSSAISYINAYLKHVNHPPNHPIHKMLPLTINHDHDNENENASNENRLLHFGLFYRKPKSKWHNGRVVLLGDACHATLPYAGQGANQAIEDAIVLTQCLEDCQYYDIEKAFSVYYQKRFQRTQFVVDSAKWMGRLFHTEGKVSGFLRDQFLHYLMHSGLFLKIAEKEIVHNCPLHYDAIHQQDTKNKK